MTHATTSPEIRNSRSLILSALLAGIFFLPPAYAQTAQQPSTASGHAAQTPAPAQSMPSAQAPANAQQKLKPVTTTVVVMDKTADTYLPQSVTVGTLDGAPIQQAPLSVSVFTRSLLSDQVTRLLSDVVANDASVGDDYVAVGYYGWYMIRGFPIDLATGLEVNGMTIAGEQDVPLENKESVEILKGIAGVESGVANAGGLINFVTKRPANVGALDMATDERGAAYGATDLGHLFGSRKQVGARVNLAGERIVPYMNDTEGWRAVGAGAADWKIDAATTLKGDFEYQHKTERDGSGYQLLGGAALPEIHRIYRSTMLGDQPWGPPDTYDTFNTDARLDRSFSPAWSAFAAANFSHSLIQDNVIYAYGTPFDANGNVDCPGAPNAPAFFFCPDGSYGIYDYRNPGELRIDSSAEAMLIGHIRTGTVTEDLVAGGNVFLRSVQMPGYFTVQNPSDPNGVVQNGAVYAYVGAENIYQPMTTFAAPGNANSLESTAQKAGPRRLYEDSHQSALVLQDRVHLPGRIQLLASGRLDSLRDNNYSLVAKTPCVTSLTPGPAGDPCATASNPDSVLAKPIPHDDLVWLPQYAVTYNPIENLTLYSNYSEILSLGVQGPWWVDNANEFLAPFHTRQVEVGAKYEPAQSILLTAALFHMRAPFIYSKPLTGPDSACPNGNPGDYCFEQQGRETHNGVELNAQGQAARWLSLNASATAMNAIATNTGTPSYDNKQVINVPHLRVDLFADLTVPRIRGLHLMPGWNFTSRKEALFDDSVSVPAYNLLNLGARYTPGGDQGRITFRIYANNITNKLYWSDTGANYGDMFLWLGAPTTVRLSAHYRF